MTSESTRPQRFRIQELMVLIAGLGFGFWIAGAGEQKQTWRIGSESFLLLGVVAVLGGLSVVGPPLLLRERLRRRGGAWGPGKLFWFTQGMASWLLWPPVVVRRVRGDAFTDSTTGLCYVYGTPLMALYVGAALLTGGWLRKRRRRRFAARSWRERFGLLLGLAWACTGAYVLYLLYAEDIRR